MGHTRQALEGAAYAFTHISCSAPSKAMLTGGPIELRVGPSKGMYNGKLTARVYVVRVRVVGTPSAVQLWRSTHAAILPQHSSMSAFDFADSGWVFSNAVGGGRLHIKTPLVSTSEAFALRISHAHR